MGGHRRERVILVGFRKDLNIKFDFPKETHKDHWRNLFVVVPKLAIDEEKY